ncbi:MAG: PKD domain-containing protein, partial [Polaribacter sp.]
MIKKIFFLLIILSVTNIFSQGATISDATGFCSDTSEVFNSLANNGVAEPGPNYSCLTTVPNPSWYFLKIDQPGNLSLQISQVNTAGDPLDVDFIAWGPFSERQLNQIQNNSDYSFLVPANEVGCSYSPSNTENLSIINARTGEYYLVLITNYDNQPGIITMQETNPGGASTGTTDCSIVAGDLGPDQNVCEGTNITLDGTPTNAVAASYIWELDTGSGFNAIPGQTNAILQITNNVSGIYRVTVKDTDGNTGQDEVQINFYVVPIANQPTDINFCDTDGTNTFTLATEKDAEILNGQDPAIFEVLYFNSMADAIANTGAITTYTNSSSLSETLYARVQNLNNNNCFSTTSFNIQVSIIPVPQDPTIYRFCDNTSAG